MKTTAQTMAEATTGQLGLWLVLGVLFVYLGFRRGKGWGWRILGVIGILNLLLSLGEIARRTGKPAVAAP